MKRKGRKSFSAKLTNNKSKKNLKKFKAKDICKVYMNCCIVNKCVENIAKHYDENTLMKLNNYPQKGMSCSFQ